MAGKVGSHGSLPAPRLVSLCARRRAGGFARHRSRSLSLLPRGAVHQRWVPRGGPGHGGAGRVDSGAGPFVPPAPGGVRVPGPLRHGGSPHHQRVRLRRRRLRHPAGVLLAQHQQPPRAGRHAHRARAARGRAHPVPLRQGTGHGRDPRAPVRRSRGPPGGRELVLQRDPAHDALRLRRLCALAALRRHGPDLRDRLRRHRRVRRDRFRLRAALERRRPGPFRPALGFCVPRGPGLPRLSGGHATALLLPGDGRPSGVPGRRERPLPLHPRWGGRCRRADRRPPERGGESPVRRRRRAGGRRTGPGLRRFRPVRLR